MKEECKTAKAVCNACACACLKLQAVIVKIKSGKRSEDRRLMGFFLFWRAQNIEALRDARMWAWTLQIRVVALKSRNVHGKNTDSMNRNNKSCYGECG
jgi:hypothetical protein